MLLVYLEPFQSHQLTLLRSWADHVHYWPRSWANTQVYNAAIPIDWWIMFASMPLADIWLLQYSEHSRIIYREV